MISSLFTKKPAMSSTTVKLKGSVVVVRRSVLDDVTGLNATVFDNVHELLGKGISCQLVSSVDVDPNNGNRGIVGPEAYVKNWVTKIPSLTAESECKLKVTFHWDVYRQGVPGAVIVKNHHHSEFFLKTVTIDDVAGRGAVVFLANSWVYPARTYHYNRVFFTNDPYLPSEMPAALRPYREEELRHLRGDDNHGPYKEHERVYRYDVYNDLSEPGSGGCRPILGGSDEHPYPRRCRTGRSRTRADPRLESRLSILEANYVPRDEWFGGTKQSDFKGFLIKAVTNGIVPAIRTYVDLTPHEFDSFDDIIALYEGGLKLPHIAFVEELKKRLSVPFLRHLLPECGKYIFKLPIPHIIKEDKSAWRSDEEFGREMLAGVNPVVIKRLTEFPPRSALDPCKFGDQTSKITTDHIQRNLDGISVQQALEDNRLYMLDHHDHLIPFLDDINKLDATFVYAALPHERRHAQATRHRAQPAFSTSRRRQQRRRHHRRSRQQGLHAADACRRRRRGVALAARQVLRRGERLRLAPTCQPLAEHARRDGAVRDRGEPAAERGAPGAQTAAAALPRHAHHQRPGAPDARQRRRHLRASLLPRPARARHVRCRLQEHLELHRASSPRRSHQKGHGGGGCVETGQGAAADRGLPVRGGRAGGVVGDRAVGGRLLRHLLPDRPAPPGRRGGAGMVERSAGGGARRHQGPELVAGDDHRGGAGQVVQHHHLDRVGAARGRQLRPVPVRRLLAEPADGEPAADAGARHGGVQGAGATPGRGIHPHHRRPAAHAPRHLTDRGTVQALRRRGVPRPARHAGVDVGRQGEGGVPAVRRPPRRDRGAHRGDEPGPPPQEPHGPGQAPLHAAVPQHVRRRRRRGRAHGQGHPQQHHHLSF